MSTAVLSALLLLSADKWIHPPTACIDIGENVTPGLTTGMNEAPPKIAIHIGSDGVVTIFVGAVVPDLKDDRGNVVKIRKVQVIKEPVVKE